MQIATTLAPSTLAIFPEQGLEILEQVGVRSEMAEVMIATPKLIPKRPIHVSPVVAMKAIALHKSGMNSLTAKDLLENAHHRSSARSRRAGDRNDRVTR